jgi:pimeloyl-ACP methyl ester carboxylesterase
MQVTDNLGQARMTDYLQVDNQRIAYTEAGSSTNPPVLFLHGIMSHRGVWARTIEILQQDFHCVSIDHLGFGESDKPKSADYSIAKQAERALNVADLFGFEKFVVVGHSMGGQIATYLTINLAPERVNKLVSVSGVVTGELSNWVQNFTRKTVGAGEKFPAIYSTSLALTKASKAYSYFVFRSWFFDIRKTPYELWELDRQIAFNSDISYSTPRAWDSLNATDLTSSLKNITAPTLVIFGTQDATVPVSQAHVFKENLPTAQLELFDECGHFPMYEKFDEYIKPLQRFLKQ